MDALVGFTKEQTEKIKLLSERFGISMENAANLAAQAGAERFFRDPEEKKPARIVILKTSEPPE